eukprot:355368-Chlamydomonas_euryale.AAC.11
MGDCHSHAWRCVTANTRRRGGAARKRCCNTLLRALRRTACRWREKMRCSGEACCMRVCARRGGGHHGECWRVGPRRSSEACCRGREALATLMLLGLVVRAHGGVAKYTEVAHGGTEEGIIGSRRLKNLGAADGRGGWVAGPASH